MRTRLPALVAVGALVVLAAVVSRGGSAVPLGETKPLFGWLRLPGLFHDGSDLREAPPRERPIDVDGFWPTAMAVGVLLLPVIALVVAIIAVLVISLRARKIGVSTPVMAAHEEPTSLGGRTTSLLRAAEAARRVLDAHEGGPPGDAVIAAWLELERVADESGTGKLSYQTPTEFTDVLQGEHPAIQRAVGELRRLYHRARFGPPGTVNATDAEAARRALDEITSSMVTS